MVKRPNLRTSQMVHLINFLSALHPFIKEYNVALKNKPKVSHTIWA